MRTEVNLFFIFLLLSMNVNSYAQDENLQAQLNSAQGNNNRTYMLTGLETSTVSFINTTTKDSSGVAPYVSAYINYYHKTHFGMKGQTYFLTKDHNSGFYLTALSAYYANYSTKLVPFISYTRLILHDNASIPYSPISNEIFVQLRYTTQVVDPAMGVDIGFGNDENNNDEALTEVNAFASISHWFTWDQINNQVFALVPTVQLNAGIDRYFRFLQTTRYVSHNRSILRLMHGGSGNGRGQNNNGTTTTETYVLSESNDFALSNLELNAYLQYSKGRFSISPSGSLYFPLRGEDRTAYGYWQVNINYAIK